MSPNQSEASYPSDTEILITRVVNAPRELVWKVWTDPRHAGRWWGPEGFTTTTQIMEVRPGGEWRYVMHGPDGHDYENIVTYLEIAPPERLVYQHGGAGDTEAIHFQSTVTFTPAPGNKTRVMLRSQFPSKKERDFVIETYRATEGGKQHLARLDAYLETQQLGVGERVDHPFSMTRVVQAPRELVWKVWTQKEHLAQWFGPQGVTMPKCTLDFRPGGIFHYEMQTLDGNLMWGRWEFRDIAAPEKLVFISGFADEAGEIARAPFHNQWPLKTLSTVLFAEHAGLSKGTVISLTWEPIDATDEERTTFAKSHASMNQGWSGTFERLSAYLAKL